jgi:hypothetical protein
MSATMKTMELIFADLLSPDQLMEDDIIKYGGEFLTVKTITAVADGYDIETVNDFDEREIIFVLDDAMLNWYVYPIDND